MKILFTGASSFTGMWFVKELAAAGHEVTACFKNTLEAYTDNRRKRIDQILPLCSPVFDCPFGSEVFLQAIAHSPAWDLFCHHAADVTNYKDPNFDFVAALANNTCNLKLVLQALSEKGCRKLILTGTVFEQNEGAGSDHLRAVSPYGLSKGMTTDVFQYYSALFGLSLGKFVIPNPFGPFEEIRYTTSLVQSWIQGKKGTVHVPRYVRDNIHVSLLARAYRFFVDRLPSTPGFEKFNPSGYVETQGAFTARFAQEIGKRLGLECPYECLCQVEFLEPKVRINTDVLNFRELGWDEEQAWDDLANYYITEFGQNTHNVQTPQ